MSRPNKGQLPTAPFYLQTNPPPYCRTCGRVISSHSAAAITQDLRSFCSSSCRSRKPAPFDRGIEAEFVNLLREQRVVLCSAVERAIFSTHEENQDAFDKEPPNQAKDSKENQELGMKRAKERERVKCAARRLVVHGFRQNDSAQGGIRFCEAVTEGRVVEPSFAKGDWGVRWRE
ncbi:hypothetical protein BC830DRAFT_1068696 [Chytriomyces sp. MP71]|nr:hypothetical protein BC830DRAFT_1068696 [Chytriomyces sp. MP71]